MPPRSRYAVDPSLTAQHSQQQYQSSQEPQLHPVSDARPHPPTGPYAPSQQPPPPLQQAPSVQNVAPHPSYIPPTQHIPPPPHSSGPSLSGPRVRIDPSQMPNPIEAQEMDQNLWDEEDFLSCNTKGVIPLSGTDWRGVDQGNSLPRHLRATLPVIPSNSQLLDTAGLPLGLIVQPFAPLRYDENPVPLVSSWVSGSSAFDPPTDLEGEEGGPPRCERCRGYINPWVRFIDGGRKWSCNLCGTPNAVTDPYFCHLAPSGHRMDHDARPELQHGTVDFVAPQIYWAPQPPPSGSLIDSAVDQTADAIASTAHDLLSGLQSSLGTSREPTPQPFKEKEKERKLQEKRLRRPAPMGRVFVIDVSRESVDKGVVAEVCEGLKRALYEKESHERIGIVTVAESVGFWNLSGDKPSLLVVSDLEDMYIPLATGFLVDAVDARVSVEALLDMLPRLDDGVKVAAGSAVKGALAGLRSLGGQINLFLSALPTLGSGKLSARDDPTVYNTDKEKALFMSADPFWRLTAEQLAETGVGVNVFFFPDRYTDVASVGTLASVTGGELFFHPKFSPARDRDGVQDEIKRILTQETGYNATIRIRCSNGLRISDHLGNFYQRSLTDLEFGTIDEAKAFGAILKYDARLDDRQPAFVQVAILYTSASGERRVRCLNMSFAVTSLIGNVFRFADLDATVTLFYKQAIDQMGTKSLRDIRKQLTDRSNRVLYLYRRHCAPAVQAGQLILPEGFKLLPLYTLCMLKTKPLKGGNVTSDVRALYMRTTRAMSVVATMTMLYPRLLAIHDLAETAGFPGPNGRLSLPRFLRASYGWMVAEGAYLLSNGEGAMIWFGGAVSPQILDDLYGVESLDELDTRMTRLPKLPTLLSTQVRNLVTHLEGIVGHSMPVTVIRQNLDGSEIEFANQLVEDSNNDALGYTDYLMAAHKSISNELSGSGSKEGWMPWT